MSGKVTRRRRLSESGFTIVELLVYFVIAVIVVAGVYQLLIGQNRLYMKQRELQDVRTSLRAAGNLLAFEFRQASAASGDLYGIGPDSVKLRSIQGTGIICGEHTNLPRYGLWGTTGEFFDSADDSALVFASGNVGAADDTWKIVAQHKVMEKGVAGVGRCGWTDKVVGKGKGVTKGTGPTMEGVGVPDIAVETRGDMDNVYLGAPYRAFRPVTYGIYQDGDRYWLGRRVGSAANYERLTGPLRAPADSGLYFVYYDSAGAATNDPAQVHMVDIILRAESLGQVRRPGQEPGFQQDTLTIRVSLRG
ncbi:MAG: prepilin-type N-terminal cleavage/methylation domain-containing protein [Gemmatimonadota bacterium]|nr:MAG: prepilin-type N-terminal cleavage/methylation domain-containing protein [Gemmatimonadota bacterium]